MENIDGRAAIYVFCLVGGSAGGFLWLFGTDCLDVLEYATAQKEKMVVVEGPLGKHAYGVESSLLSLTSYYGLYPAWLFFGPRPFLPLLDNISTIFCGPQPGRSCFFPLQLFFFLFFPPLARGCISAEV